MVALHEAATAFYYLTGERWDDYSKSDPLPTSFLTY